MEETASIKAQETGSPVIVDADTTETSLTTALPNGLFQFDGNVRPVRVQRGTGWVPTDTSLTTAVDGSLAPVASAMNMRFSGGGSGPLVVVTTNDGSTISYTWPTALPIPTISGGTATYASVLPDVDLQLTAGVDNYSEAVVVKNAQAAANPALAALTLDVQGQGLNLATDSNGQVNAVDSHGTVVLQGSIPQMWDSTVDVRVGPKATAADPGSGHVTRLGTQLKSLRKATANLGSGSAASSDTTLTLTPPAAALTGAAVQYPVYIDPSMSSLGSEWIDVQSNGVTDYNGTGGYTDLKVGRCDFAGCNGPWTSRAYFSFDTSHLTRLSSSQTTTAKIYSAAIYATEIHEAVDCLSEPVSLYVAGGISATTTWPGPATTNLESETSNDGTNCPSAPANNVTFDNANVLSNIQSAANTQVTSMTFGLIAGSESNSDYWKRFALNPKLTVTYNFPPSTPINNSSDTGVDPDYSLICNGTTYVTTTHPHLRAKDHDNNNPALQVKLWLDVYPHGSSTVQWTSIGQTVGSDTVLSNFSSTLSDGTYDYVARASNVTTDGTAVQNAASASGRVTFTVDTTAPAGTPTASSWDFPTDFWGARAGTGSIHLDDGAATNAVGFAYGWDSASSIPAIPDTQCTYNQQVGSGGFVPDVGGGADITPATLSVGPHTLYVRTFDAAHNLSAATGSYKVYVSPYLGNSNTRPEAESFTPSAPVFSPVAPAGTPTARCGGTITTGTTSYNEATPSASGGHDWHLLATCGDSNWGPTYIFQLPTVGLTADYAFGVGEVQANHFGTYQAGLSYGGAIHWFNDANGNPYQIVGYNSASGTVAFQSLGGMHLQTGTTYSLVLRAIGKAAGSTGYVDPHGAGGAVNDNGYAFDFDYLNMTPINNVTVASFGAAMNNNGISSDGVGGANIGPSGSGSSISAQALAAAGYGPGQVVTIDPTANQPNGVSFTMPAANAAGNNNVIAMGQTIPVPWTPAPNIDNIDLLVTTTCLATGTLSSAAITIGLNNANSVPDTDPNYFSPTSNQLPAIPDWISGNSAPLTHISASGFDSNGNPTFNTITRPLTMAYDNMGGTKTTTNHPSLYHIQLPVFKPAATVQSITLPNIGSDLTTSCKPSIHIFAISHSQ